MAGAVDDDSFRPIRAGGVTRRAFAAGALLAIATASISSHGAAADVKYPERPLRIVVPFGTGSIADLTTRLVSEKLGAKLGQRIVVENLPGAGGAAAARAALQGH